MPSMRRHDRAAVAVAAAGSGTATDDTVTDAMLATRTRVYLAIYTAVSITTISVAWSGGITRITRLSPSGNSECCQPLRLPRYHLERFYSGNSQRYFMVVIT